MAFPLGFAESVTPNMDGIVDLHNYIMTFLVFILYIVVFYLYKIFREFYFVLKFPFTAREAWTNRWDQHHNMRITHGTRLELFWTLSPALILYAIGVPSFALLYAMEDVLYPLLTFKAIGHQWYWSYEFPEQKYSFDSNMLFENELRAGDYRLLSVDNPIVLPIKTHINLLITSQDVLHSWAVPSFGVKMDAVPGRLNQVALFIKREGLFYGQCSELCGANHAFMPIEVHAFPVKTFLNLIKEFKVNNA